MGQIGKGVFPWIGGKSTYANRIVRLLPSETGCYVEAFGGAAGILWNKPEQYHEVYNDLDGDLVHFFETLRTRGDDLKEELEQVVYSRELHEKWSSEFYQEQERPDDPIERAVRFFYLRYSNFAGTHKKTGFRTAQKRNMASSFKRGVDELEWFRERIRGVTIENLDFETLIERYDDPETLFYLDPPYYELDHYQEGNGFDHRRLYEVLTEVEGYVVLSYEELPPEWTVRPEGFRVETYTAPYRSPQEDDVREATERLLLNYDPDEVPTMDGGLQTGLSSF